MNWAPNAWFPKKWNFPLSVWLPPVSGEEKRRVLFYNAFYMILSILSLCYFYLFLLACPLVESFLLFLLTPCLNKLLQTHAIQWSRNESPFGLSNTQPCTEQMFLLPCSPLFFLFPCSFLLFLPLNHLPHAKVDVLQKLCKS